MSQAVWNLPNSVIAKLREARAKDQKIVLATGVFDILHAEHRKFLEKAKARGDFLIVGLEADARVTSMKGPGRPINKASVRQENLASWNLADCIFILPEKFKTSETHEKLIQLIRPSILAVSSHTAHLAQKAAILQKFGGQVIVVHEHNPALSSTQILSAKTS